MARRWDVFHARVDRAWEAVRALAAASSGTLAVVTHGLVCRSLAARHLSLADGVTVPERWENTSLTILEAGAPWRVSLLNCIAHLEDSGAAPARDPPRREVSSGRLSAGSAISSMASGCSVTSVRPVMPQSAQAR